MGREECSGTTVAKKRHSRGKSTGFVSRGTEHLRTEGGRFFQWLRPNCCTRLPRTLSNGSSRSPSQKHRRPLSHSGCLSARRGGGISASCLPCCGTMTEADDVSSVSSPVKSRRSSCVAMLRPSCWRALDNEVWDAPDPWSHGSDDSPERVRIANRYLHGFGDGTPPKDANISPFKDVVPSPGVESYDIPIGMIEEASMSPSLSDLPLPKSKLCFDEKTSHCTTEIPSNCDDVADDISSVGPADAENGALAFRSSKLETGAKSAVAQDIILEASESSTSPGMVGGNLNIVDCNDKQQTSNKPSGRPKARPPGKAPPPRKALGASPASLPHWCGPVPPPEWKADRVVNWQPIRQAGRWNGSVWEAVNNRMKEEGFTPLPDNLLNIAFMKRADESPPLRRSASRLLSARGSSRRLSQRAALTADLLYAQLVRKGVQEVSRLSWVTGVAKDGSGKPSSNSELSDDILECLLGLLRAASGEEGRLLNWEEDSSLVPAEAFLQSLVKEAGPLKILDERVEIALLMARFPAEAASLEAGLQLGIRTIREVVNSSAIPSLLEGVLLLGNYVNANCKTLSGAVGVTLDSLVKLAHTRCIQGKLQDCSKKDGGNAARKDNALLLLVEHLQQTRPGFVAALSRDLNGCRRARDLDPKAMEETLQALVLQIRTIEARLEAHHGQSSKEQASRIEPEALKASRLEHFLTQAKPRIQAMQQLMKEFKDATMGMRQWFAESTDASFVDMMRNLVMLRDALPALKPQPLPPCPRPCNLRHITQSSHVPKSRRAQSLPPTNDKDKIDGKELRRCSSEPPRAGTLWKATQQSDLSAGLKQPRKPVGPKPVAKAPPKRRSLEVVVQEVPEVHEQTQKQIANIRTPPRRLRTLQEIPFSVPKHHASVDFYSSTHMAGDVSKASEINLSAKFVATNEGTSSISESKVQVASFTTSNVPRVSAVSGNVVGAMNASTGRANVPSAFGTSCITASEARIACP